MYVWGILNVMSTPLEVRNIPARINPDQLDVDLEILAQLAREHGAGEAALITAPDVIFNPEIVSRVEQEMGYRSCHWPVNYLNDFVEEAVQVYQNGIIFVVPNPENIPEYSGGPIHDANHRKAYRKVYEIVSLIESNAFYLGYHLAMGFARGNCRAVFCPGQKECICLRKGERCIHPLRSRPSMEAVGIDLREMARKRGWEIPPETTAFFAGLVMIA